MPTLDEMANVEKKDVASSLIVAAIHSNANAIGHTSCWNIERIKKKTQPKQFFFTFVSWLILRPLSVRLFLYICKTLLCGCTQKPFKRSFFLLVKRLFSAGLFSDIFYDLSRPMFFLSTPFYTWNKHINILLVLIRLLGLSASRSSNHQQSKQKRFHVNTSKSSMAACDVWKLKVMY